MQNLLAGFPFSKRVFSARAKRASTTRFKSARNLYTIRNQIISIDPKFDRVKKSLHTSLSKDQSENHLNKSAINIDKEPDIKKGPLKRSSTIVTETINQFENKDKKSFDTSPELTPLFKPENSKDIYNQKTAFCTPSNSISMTPTLRFSQVAIKSMKSKNHNLTLEINKTFNRTFMILFKYLKFASKVQIPSCIYSSFKIGLIGDVKSDAEKFLKKYCKLEQKYENDNDVQMCLKHICYICTSKINFNGEAKNIKSKGQQLMIEFNKLDTKYSYKLDKILCENAYEKAKSTPQTKKSKLNMKLSSNTRQKFLSRIQSRETTPI